MYKRSWPSVIISVMLVGSGFLGMGILALFCGYGAQSIPAILLGLVIIAGGICLFRWYRKKTMKDRGGNTKQNGKNSVWIWILMIVLAIVSIGIGVYTAH